MQDRGFEPKDDGEARALFDAVVEGATRAALLCLFAARDVPAERRWERLGVLQLVLELDFAVPEAAVSGAMCDVAALQSDKAWLRRWEDSRRIDIALQALAAAISALRTSGHRLLHQETLLPPRALAALNHKS
jgi:hypothetical protein